MKNVIIYSRVSSDEQAKGCSLDYQEKTISEYCERMGYNIVKCYKEDFSAKDFEHRKVFQEIMAHCKQHRKEIDIVLCLRWNRYSRNTTAAYENLEYFKNIGVEVNTVDEHIDWMQDESKILLGVYITMADVDNAKRSKATKEGIRQSQEEGKTTNMAPYGYKNVKIDDYNRYVEIVPTEAKIVQSIFSEVAKGLVAPITIRNQFVRMTAYKMHKSNFLRMLRNRYYIGEVYVKAYKEKPAYWTKGMHQAIIDVDVFNRVQDILDGSRRKQARAGKCVHPDLFLRKFLVCPVCGASLTGSRSTSCTGSRYAYYHCSVDSKHFRFNALEANDLFRRYVGALTPNDTVMDLYDVVLKDLHKSMGRDMDAQRATLKEERAQLDQRLAQLEDKFLDGEISKEDFGRIKIRYQQQRNAISEKVDLLKTPDATNIEHKLDYAITLINSLPKYVNDAPVDVKMKLVSSMFPEKLLFDGTSYRTDTFNEVLSLIYQQTNVLRGNKTKNPSDFSNGLLSVPRTRLELAQRNRHYPLKVACLPISPPGHYIPEYNFRECKYRYYFAIRKIFA